MQRYSIRAAATVGLLAASLSAALSTASAADNSGIVIIDRQHQSSPFGQYDSHSRTEVYGPSSGYRYEEYSYPAPGVTVYSGYGGYGHGYGGGRGRGRVIERYGPGAHGRYGAGRAPSAPRIDNYGNGYRNRDYGNYGHQQNHADYGRYRSPSNRERESLQHNRPELGRDFSREPFQRAVEPPEHAVQSTHRIAR